MSDNNKERRLQELGNEERMKLDTLLVEERQRYDELNSNQITLRIENAELKDENYNLTEEVMRLTDANDNVRENIMQLQGQLNEVTASRDDITERYQRLKQKLTRMRLQFQELDEVSENNWHIMAGEINDIFEKLSNDKGLMSVSLKKEFRNIMENINIDCVQALCHKWYDAVAAKKRKDIDEDKATLKKAKTDITVMESSKNASKDDDDATDDKNEKTCASEDKEDNDGTADKNTNISASKDKVDDDETADDNVNAKTCDEVEDDATSENTYSNGEFDVDAAWASKDKVDNDETADENAKTCDEVEDDATADKSASKDEVDGASKDKVADKTCDEVEVEDALIADKSASKDLVDDVATADKSANTLVGTPVTKHNVENDDVVSPEY